MFHLLIPMVWLAGAAPAQVTRAEDQLNMVLVAINDQWRMCRSIEADIFMEAPKAGSETTGKYYYRVEGTKQQYREEQKTQNFGKGRKNLNPITWQEMLSIGDGDAVTTSINRMGNPVTYKTKQVPGQAGRGGTALVNRLVPTHELKLMPKGDLEGRDTWIIEATPMTSEANKEGKTVFTFDQRSGLLVAMVEYDSAGEVISLTELRNLRVDEKLSDDLFVYKARPAEKIHDMTNKK